MEAKQIHTDLDRCCQVAGTADGCLTLSLYYRPPLNIAEILAYLGKRAIPGVEEVINQRYRRTIVFPHSKGILEAEPEAEKNALSVRLCLDNLSDLSQIIQHCRNLFDLDADPAAINSMLATDPMMAQLVETRPGLRVPGTVDGFDLAVRAILGQQVSVVGARTLAGRLVSNYGNRLPEPQGTLTHFFPTPEQVIQADPATMSIPRARAAALQALALAVAEGDLILERGADREQTIARLLRLPGVGPWTTSYISMRALGDPDAFPASDLGLRKAFERQGLAATPRSITQHAEIWRPWRAYAVYHLWASL